MTLSEEELKLLEQMERALSEEDPKFVSTLRGTSLRQHARRRAIAAGFVFVVGIALLMTGAIIQQTIVGLLGFVVMLGAATVFLAALRRTQAGADPRATGHPGLSVIDGGRRSGGRGRGARAARQRNSAGFMSRMEDRWRRRRDEGGF